MERVVTINLNGNPYQLDESAYDALRAYMARAEAALGANPDKAEIIRDLEQAIADKISAHLNARKTVVSSSEMQQALEQMGPVDGDESAETAGASTSSEDGDAPTRKLHRVYDRHSITGVSAGLAAYAKIDVNWVRAFWIITPFFTGGFTLLAYVVLAFMIPLASTPEQVAAAHGAPFNAQEVIDEAKRRYAQFTGPDGEATKWTGDMRNAWRKASRENDRARAAAASYPPPQAVSTATRLVGALLSVLFALITVALFIALVFVMVSLFTTGAVLGWTLPLGVPVWMAAIAALVLFGIVTAPFAALRSASNSMMTGHPMERTSDGGVGFLAFTLIAGWFAYITWPEAREAIDAGMVLMRTWIEQMTAIIRDWN